MNKKQLLEIGISEEHSAKVLELLKAEYVEKTLVEQKDTELSNLKEQVKERDNQIKELKKFEGDNAQLKQKLEELEVANKAKSEEYDSTLLLERKKNAVKLALLEDEAGKPFDVSMVTGMFNLDTINLNEDGSIATGFKEQNETLRKDKAFLFTQAQTDKGSKRIGDTPPDGQKKNPPVDTPESYGARLAKAKLQMLGITPKSDNNEQ